MFDAGIPADRFHVYVEFKAYIMHSGADEDLSRNSLYDMMASNANFTDYVMTYVRTLSNSPFVSTREVTMRAKQAPPLPVTTTTTGMKHPA